jgi:hypothetical protein
MPDLALERFGTVNSRDGNRFHSPDASRRPDGDYFRTGQAGDQMIYLDKTHAWNPQQWAIFYWNPKQLESQFYFNDKNTVTGEVCTVLYDLEKR